jgi:uncharacterized membrane protein
MAGVAALFVVASLGFFVKYAWDNNWIGPTGRVLFGAVFSLALLAVGTRQLNKRYRPLGQALCGAGLAGLYVTSFGAHGFYDLIPRGLATLLMVCITASAVLLSVRLDTRLLGLLAWVGGYLTPVLLSTGEDRAVALFGYLGLLAVGALAVDRFRPWVETLPVALLGTWLLYLAWFSEHYGPRRFGVAAAAVVAFTALFSLGPPRSRTGMPVVALVVGALLSVLLYETSAANLGLLLLALGVLMATAWSRWSGAPLLGVATTALAAALWISRYYDPRSPAPALAVVVALYTFYVLTFLLGVGRGEAFRRTVVAGHVAAVSCFWIALWALLYPQRAWALAATSVGLAVLYLGLGLAFGRAGGVAARLGPVFLGVAAALTTVAIPVRMGLNGITLGWAIEGVILVALGLRFESRLARWSGYGVLGAAVFRLASRHMEAPAAGFTPVAKPTFAVWLCVAAALVVAARMVLGRFGDAGDGPAVPGLVCTAVVLLFVATTRETHLAFEQMQSSALANHDGEAARHASLMGGLAMSLLWSTFAAGLLVVGVSLRNRPFFYAAYGLFALAAAKVALVDLSSLRTLYRILSLFSLGVLLMAGAFLVIRFRDRLLPADDPS